MLSVGADVQFRIWDPVLSVMAVKDLNTATRMTAHNAMTKALLRRPLQEIQMERLKIGDQLLVGGFSRGTALGLAAGPGPLYQLTLNKDRVTLGLGSLYVPTLLPPEKNWVRPHVEGQR